MKKYLAAIFVMAMAISCATPKVITKTETVYKDSVRVEVHERIVHDTVEVEIPLIVEKIITEDDSSHLENAFAKSDASIRNGKLHHSLETKPQTVAKPVAIPVADTTTTHTSTAIEKSEDTKIEYVEKELSWFRKTEIYGFWCLLLFVLLYFGFKNRKVIWALVRRFI